MQYKICGLLQQLCDTRRDCRYDMPEPFHGHNDTLGSFHRYYNVATACGNISVPPKADQLPSQGCIWPIASSSPIIVR